MGILIDALSIVTGSLLGSKSQSKTRKINHSVLAIAILIVSLVGFLENIYSVKGNKIDSAHLLVVLFSLIAGSIIGDYLHIDEKLNSLSKTSDKRFNAFIDSTIFFSVGGLQISGPVLLVLNNNSSQLVLKGFIDFPFAIAFGATYGTISSLSALPVAIMQVIIALITYLFAGFLNPEMTAQLCAMGYIILFFSGYNLIIPSQSKINNINMLPGILIIVLYNLIINVMEKI